MPKNKTIITGVISLVIFCMFNQFQKLDTILSQAAERKVAHPYRLFPYRKGL